MIVCRQDTADEFEALNVSYWDMSDAGKSSCVLLVLLFDRAVGLWRWTTLRACETSKRTRGREDAADLDKLSSLIYLNHASLCMGFSV
jgi:hypothetical protein